MTMTPPEVDHRSIIVMCEELLQRIVGRYEQEGIDLPSRKYWTMGAPAADCEQLVVSFMQAYIGPVGDEANEPQNCNSPRTAQLDIQILRCIPSSGPRGGAPSAEKIQKASEIQAIDAWLLLDMSADLDTWDPLGRGLGVIATVDAGEAQGGFQGPVLHLTVAIP